MSSPTVKNQFTDLNEQINLFDQDTVINPQMGSKEVTVGVDLTDPCTSDALLFGTEFPVLSRILDLLDKRHKRTYCEIGILRGAMTEHLCKMNRIEVLLFTCDPVAALTVETKKAKAKVMTANMTDNSVTVKIE